MKQVRSRACYVHHAGFLLGLFFDPENVDDILLKHQLTSVDYMALYPRRQNSLNGGNLMLKLLAWDC
jgi:hypothetical protein